MIICLGNFERGKNLETQKYEMVLEIMNVMKAIGLALKMTIRIVVLMIGILLRKRK